MRKERPDTPAVGDGFPLWIALPVILVCSVIVLGTVRLGWWTPQIVSRISQQEAKQKVADDKLDAIAEQLGRIDDKVDRILHGKGPEPLSLKL